MIYFIDRNIAIVGPELTSRLNLLHYAACHARLLLTTRRLAFLLHYILLGNRVEGEGSSSEILSRFQFHNSEWNTVQYFLTRVATVPSIDLYALFPYTFVFPLYFLSLIISSLFLTLIR